VNPKLRPDCETILSQQNEWRLTHEILTSNKEFNEIVGKISVTKSITENFIDFFIQNKFVDKN
jgi:hypothetical protein